MSAKRSDYPTVGASFIVENKAIELLKSLLSESWLWRQQTPDFFVDYNVEVVEAGELTGVQFGLQVKGSQSVKIRKGCIRYRMDRKPLLYYRDNARLPVFLVLSDVKQRKAYWLFAQQYLREHAGAAQLDSQNTLTVAFNIEDCFSDQPRFSEALKAAEHYMRDLYPGSPIAAVEQRQQALQKLAENLNSQDDSGEKTSFPVPSLPVARNQRTLFLPVGRPSSGNVMYLDIRFQFLDKIIEQLLVPPLQNRR